MKRLSENPVRVLFVVRSLHVGGMEQMVIELAAGLDPKRYLVRFCTIEDAGQLAERVLAAGIELDALDKPAGLRLEYIGRLRAIIDAWKPDIIHTHNDAGHFYASLANLGIRRKVKLVHTKHGRGEPDDRKSVIRNCISSRLSDVVVAVSEDVAKVGREVENVPAGKIRTIINGVELAPYLKLDRVEKEAGETVFGHVGRLSPVKNQKLLLDAFARVCEQLPTVRLSIAGDGPMKAELEERARDLGIASQDSFLGYRSDIATVMSEFDVFLLSSVSEGTPLVVIEAMAAGLPVIATAVGGLPEMISDQETGVLVPTQDVEAMATQMLELANHSGRRIQLGVRGRQLATTEYSLQRMLRDYDEVYEGLVE